MTFSRRLAIVFVISLIGIAIDQATKVIARASLVENQMLSYLGDTARLQLIQNRGAFLSMGASLPENVRQLIFIVGVGVMLLALLAYALSTQSIGATVSAALVCAGGISNLIDRVFNDGHVIDFLNVGVGWLRTGIFNVADVYIMVGVGLLILTAPQPPASNE